MHALHTSTIPEAQDRPAAAEKVNAGIAWFAASIDIDNALAVIELVWQSMADNNWRLVLPDHMKGLADAADNQRRALDAVIPLLRNVSNFFNENERASNNLDNPADDELLRGKISDEFFRLLDEFKWALDEYDELCPTQDHNDARFDRAKAAKRRFHSAEGRYFKAEHALINYRPQNLAELWFKVKTIGDLRGRGVIPEEHMDAVLASLVDFGKVADV